MELKENEKLFFILLLICILLGSCNTSDPPGEILSDSIDAKTDVSAVESKAVDSGDYKKCPYCSELVKKEAGVCKHCGRNL